jgi:hypothetical protein
MEEQIKTMIKELKEDIEKLDIELRAKSSKLAKMQVIKIQLENLLKGDK